MGVKTVGVAAGRGNADAMALVYDIDVRWAGTPDINLMLTPSRKWIIRQRNIGARRRTCRVLCYTLTRKPTC